MKTLNWTPAPGFRHSGSRRDEYRKGIVLFVIPAQAGIQEDQRREFIYPILS